MKKQFKNHFNRNALSVFLAFVMLLGLIIPTGASADISETESSNTSSAPNVPDDEEPIPEIPWEFPLEEGDLPLDKLKEAQLDNADLPAVISRALADERQHVNRLYAQEPDDYTVIFQNRDGGKTIYVFSVPVKTGTGTAAAADLSSDMISAQSAMGAARGVELQSTSGSASVSFSGDFLASRLGNSFADKPLFDYNIGHCGIGRVSMTELSGGITSEGADITASAREWGKAREGANEEFPITASDMTGIPAQPVPGGMSSAVNDNDVYYLNVTYSNLAGEYALKSNSSSKWLTYNGVTIHMFPYIFAPTGKWLLIYQGTKGGYLIRSQRDQKLYLTIDSANRVVVSSNSSPTTVWIIESVEGSMVFRARNTNYCLNSYLEVTSCSDGYYPTNTLWTLTNYVDFVELYEIIIPESYETIVYEYMYDIPVEYWPSNATYKSCYFVEYGNNIIMGNYEDEDGFSTTAPGITRIEAVHTYHTGITSDDTCIVVSSSEALPFQYGMTYIIRSHLDTSKLLTMQYNNASAPLALSSVQRDWNTLSQSFIIERDVNSAKYKLSATRCTAQYNAPATLGDMSSNYTLVNNADVSNTVYNYSNNRTAVALGSYNSNSSYDRWYIYRDGSNYYIVNSTRGVKEYALCAANIGGSYAPAACEYNASLDSCKWSISFFGMDVPFIKQSTDYYCGIASALQVLYGMGYDCSVFGDNLVDQMDSICKLTKTGTGGASIEGVHDFLNEKLGLSGIDLYWDNWYFPQPYLFEDCISTALTREYPMIYFFKGRLPNYPSSVYSDIGHFLCIMGYDELTGMVAYSDCTYAYGEFGIHLSTAAEIYNCTYFRALLGSHGRYEPK